MTSVFRLISIVLLLVVVLVACGDDDDDDNGGQAATPTTEAVADATPIEAAGDMTATPAGSGTDATASPAAGDETVAVEQAADAVFDAIRQHDRDRLHDHTGDHLRDRIQDRDLDHLAQCMPEGASMEVVDRTVEIEDGTATVTHTLEVTTADGETREVERVLTFEQDEDGDWVLTELPECPFQQ